MSISHDSERHRACIGLALTCSSYRTQSMQGTQLQEYEVPNARNKGTAQESFACCCQESIGLHLRLM